MPYTISRTGERRPLLRCRPGWTRGRRLWTKIISRHSATGWRVTTSRQFRGERAAKVLGEAHRGESGDRSAAQRDAQDHSRENVAEEVHAQHDAGYGDIQREEQQNAFK